jgi:hypothetical protein
MGEIHKKVCPLVAVLLNKADGDVPKVLFVQYPEINGWTLIQGLMRDKEQPYRTGIRVINNSLSLNLYNVRLRLYFSNMIFSNDDGEDELVNYYSLKLKQEEVDLLVSMSEQQPHNMNVSGLKWISVHEPELDQSFDQRMTYCWETMRKAIASTYGIKL